MLSPCTTGKANLPEVWEKVSVSQNVATMLIYNYVQSNLSKVLIYSE